MFVKCPGAGGLGQVRDQDRIRLGSSLVRCDCLWSYYDRNRHYWLWQDTVE